MALLAATRTAGGGQLYVGDKAMATGILDSVLRVLPFLSFLFEDMDGFFSSIGWCMSGMCEE